jgi:hypothetical protein
MSYNVHVDRQEELLLFQHILQGQREENILLIEAPSGLGKTLLLLEYQRLAREANLPFAMLDLKYVGAAVSEILSTLCEEWADCPFQRFRRQVESFQQSAAQVDLRGIVQFGRPTIQIAMNAPDEATSRERRRALTQALITDLLDWLGGERRAVLFIDTYNPDLVTPALRQWVEDVLLRHVRRSPNLVAVVAGQETPPLSATWENACCRRRLSHLKDPDDWMTLVERLEIPVSRETVSALCHLRQGHPLDMALELNKLRTWTWGGAS